MNKKFLDPVANIRAFGLILIILSILTFVTKIGGFFHIGSSSDLYIYLYKMGSDILYIGVGYGFRKLKKWALYLFTMLSVVEISLMIYFMLTTEADVIIFGGFIALYVVILLLLFKFREVLS